MTYDFWAEGSNPHLAAFGARNHLPSGGLTLLGRDFAFVLSFAADSYNWMASVEEYDHATDIMRLAHNIHAWHTEMARDEVARLLGLAVVVQARRTL